MERHYINMDSAQPQSIGLLAGSGRFPIIFAEAARRQGIAVHAVGVMGMASDELAEVCETYVNVAISKVGKAIRRFKKVGVHQAVMAGKIEKVMFFHPFRWLRMIPDWRATHMLMTYAARDKKDDTLLLAVIQEFARDNIIFESALIYCPEIVVKHGFLTKKRPSPSQWKDINFGWELAKEMGRLDVGQSIAVRETAVLAVEAIEGTDAAIRRAGELCKKGGFTIVKVAKPQQDMRFDVPTIGIQTIQTMHETGAKVLAIESDKTILLDEQEVLHLANKFGITIVSLNAEEVRLKHCA
jgi:DUF1009 family protein